MRLKTRFSSGQFCIVAMITSFLSGLSGGVDDQIFVWSCLVGLITRVLSGQSCLVGLMTRFLFGLSCGADDQIYFCPVSLVLWG